MRHYSTFAEAQNEIARDLAELGILVQPETMQDKDVHDNEEFLTRELQNYSYTVLNPDVTLIDNVHEAWVKQEWEDRLAGGLNPGNAYKQRHEVWDQFMERNPDYPHVGRFSYTYSKRMGGEHLQRIITELQIHPHSRQLWLPVWWEVDETRRGERRVPCSLGYWFVQRKGELHITYVMRSCDFFTHYSNDVALAAMMQKYVADEVGLVVGTFTHFVGSFHVYQKDVADVF